MKTHLIQAIEQLKRMLAEAAATVEDAVARAVRAVETHTRSEALAVIAGDAEVDRAEILIEEECLKILALYQPVASDLRQVITILKINTEIERVGDLAVNIAERAIDMAEFDENTIERFAFCDMVNNSVAMLKGALDAAASGDVALATEVIHSDDAVDAVHRGNYGRVQELIIRYPAQAGYYMDCLTVSRCLERIGDSATNIAEDVIYLESGRIVRHLHEGGNGYHGQ